MSKRCRSPTNTSNPAAKRRKLNKCNGAKDQDFGIDVPGYKTLMQIRDKIHQDWNIIINNGHFSKFQFVRKHHMLYLRKNTGIYYYSYTRILYELILHIDEVLQDVTQISDLDGAFLNVLNAIKNKHIYKQVFLVLPQITEFFFVHLQKEYSKIL